MILCTVIYYMDNSKTPHLKAFSSVEKAKIWIDTMEDDKYSKALNVQIMVDYGAMEFYKEKFEEVYNIMKDKTFNTANAGNTSKVLI